MSASAKGAERNENLLILKIKFFICAVLFVLFLSLDYTGTDVSGITADDIVSAVTADFSAEDCIQLWRKLLN